MSNDKSGGVTTNYNTQFTIKEGVNAGTITKIIMDEYEDVLIDKCVKIRCDMFGEGERVRIKEIVKSMSSTGGEAFPPYKKRFEDVFNNVCEYLKENDTIVPGGFVNFRMQKLYDYVEEMVSEACEVYFKEREYEEFTHLLSVFIEEKEPKEEVLHLVWEKGMVRLLNKRGRDVTEKYEKEFYAAAREKGISGEDLAISAVISVAPKKLVMHSPDEKSPLKETLLKIFGGKARICTGCNICKNS